MADVKRRRVLTGTVVTNGAEKTVSVLVLRRYQHALYKKMVTARKKYLAHDENNQCNVGDVVRIQECAPISKRKKWFVKEVVSEGK